jgi:hypothetical protein
MQKNNSQLQQTCLLFLYLKAGLKHYSRLKYDKDKKSLCRRILKIIQIQSKPLYMNLRLFSANFVPNYVTLVGLTFCIG